MLNSFFIIVIAIGSLLVPHDAYACASCGSGSGDPLILNANENLKLYTASRYQSIANQIHIDGQSAPNYLFKSQSFLDVGLGFRLTKHSFVSLYSGLQANQGRSTHTGWQEPLLKARWTVVNMHFARPFMPQIQLLAGYKSQLAPDKYASHDPQFLDVFGTGHQEFHFGYDIWQPQLHFPGSQNTLLMGISQTLVLPTAREVYGVSTRPGFGLGSVITLGTYYYGSNKILAGYYLSLRGKRYENGQAIEKSTSRNHALFMTLDYQFNFANVIRLTASLAGLPGSYNTTKNRTVTLSLTHAFF